MCVVFIKKVTNALVVAFNRDEFYDRASESMQFRPQEKIYSGRDLFKGGYWFVLNEKGEFAFVTNLRKKSLYRENTKTRGEVPGLLLANQALAFDLYNPFNAVQGSLKNIFYMNSIEKMKIKLTDDVVGISNSTYPCSWPKVVNGKKEFSKIDLSDSFENIRKQVLTIMQNKNAYDFVAPNTGFTEEQEKMLTPIFIQSAKYGTVSTTILIIRNEEFYIHEENYLNKTQFSCSETLKIV